AASRKGVHSIEHLGPGIPLFACCSSHHVEVHEAIRSQPSRSIPAIRPEFLRTLIERAATPLLKRVIVNPANLTRSGDAAILAGAAASFDLDRARSLAGHFVQDGTWNVPTLIRMKSEYLCDAPEFTESDELRFVSAKALAGWRKANERYAKLSPAVRGALRGTYGRLLELTSVLADAGAPMLTGSDVCGAGWLVPGFALHHEFDELAAAGLSPLKVLQMATSDAGAYLGQPDTIGRLVRGAPADLVVLSGDPLDRVENLHRIDAVVRGGRYLDRNELDAIITRAESDRPAF
ncbi:MAG: amidohydrolase family protein, partial [Aeromicrobium sp.]